MQDILEQLYQGNSLNQKQSKIFIENIIKQKLSPIQITAALISMKTRGETFEEIMGAVNVLLAHSNPFPRPNGLFADITGTGGDRKNTINISTISAVIAATCNIKIIKHGNCKISSLIGSMDILQQYNHLNTSEYTKQIYKNFETLGICFLYAPRYHTILNYVLSIRHQLKTPTLFNIVGPLINPSKPPIMLIGVYKQELLLPIAQVLKLLQCYRAMVVHCGGIDEVGLHDDTQVIELHNKIINKYTLSASDFGLNSYSIKELSCHSQKQAYEHMINLLQGTGKPAHEYVVAANVALLLKLFGHDNLQDNVELALSKIHQGIPYDYFQQLIKKTPI